MVIISNRCSIVLALPSHNNSIDQLLLAVNCSHGTKTITGNTQNFETALDEEDEKEMVA